MDTNHRPGSDKDIASLRAYQGTLRTQLRQLDSEIKGLPEAAPGLLWFHQQRETCRGELARVRSILSAPRARSLPEVRQAWSSLVQPALAAALDGGRLLADEAERLRAAAAAFEQLLNELAAPRPAPPGKEGSRPRGRSLQYGWLELERGASFFVPGKVYFSSHCAHWNRRQARLGSPIRFAWAVDTVEGVMGARVTRVK